MLEKTKKTVRSIVMVVLAVLLTLGAVSGQQQVQASKTNTGAPGSTTVSSIKNFGGGNFVSEYLR